MFLAVVPRMTKPAMSARSPVPTVARVEMLISCGVPSTLAYQWTFNGQPLSGQTSDQLLLNSVQSVQAGNYSVTVTNSRGSVTSTPATLTLVTSTAPGPIVDTTFTPNFTISGSVNAAVEQADANASLFGAGASAGTQNTVTKQATPSTTSSPLRPPTASRPNSTAIWRPPF